MANRLTPTDVDEILEEAAGLIMAVHRPKIDPRHIVGSDTADIRICAHDHQRWPCPPFRWAEERSGIPTPTSGAAFSDCPLGGADLMHGL